MVMVLGFLGPCSKAGEVNAHHLCPESMVCKAREAGGWADGTDQLARCPGPCSHAAGTLLPTSSPAQLTRSPRLDSSHSDRSLQGRLELSLCSHKPSVVQNRYT